MAGAVQQAGGEFHPMCRREAPAANRTASLEGFRPSPNPPESAADSPRARQAAAFFFLDRKRPFKIPLFYEIGIH